jgi:uncharacterized membrane protein YeiH
MNDRELLDETVLRGAMRLEADETVPRFDAVGMAALAARRASTARMLAAGLSVAVITGVIAGGVWSLILATGPAIFGQAMEGVVSIAVIAATILLPIARIAAEPAVPLSLIAALGIAILHELRERREHAHADAS